jgi:ABC-2 type transport system ATP-binding protein
MQQRLSIARVLLHDPKVLLLDEPASGLDPRARVEIRALLKELRRMGKTILISSHILHELAELCNTVGIIEQGELIYQGTVRDIMAQASGGHVVHVGVEKNAPSAAEMLAEVHGVERIDLRTTEMGDIIDVTLKPGSGLPISDIPNRLIAAGYRIFMLEEEKVNLETAFMRLTKGLVH